MAAQPPFVKGSHDNTREPVHPSLAGSPTGREAPLPPAAQIGHSPLRDFARCVSVFSRSASSPEDARVNAYGAEVEESLQ